MASPQGNVKTLQLFFFVVVVVFLNIYHIMFVLTGGEVESRAESQTGDGQVLAGHH